jgi:hypothetical protein
MLAAAAKSDEAARLILELGGGSTDGSEAMAGLAEAA